MRSSHKMPTRGRDVSALHAEKPTYSGRGRQNCINYVDHSSGFTTIR
jgi:hypothetical protein